MSSIWFVNVENTINVKHNNQNESFTCYYKGEGDTTFTQINGDFTYSDGIYSLPYTFTTTGSYTIKVVDSNNNSKFTKLSVIDYQDIANKVWDTQL